jgi:hypothetical protein
VREQSHKNEMRAALRGDFERLRARQASGGATRAARVAQPRDELREPEPAADPPAEPQTPVSTPGPAPSQPPEPEAHIEPPLPRAVEAQPEAELEPEAPVRRSRLRSLFRRA